MASIKVLYVENDPALRGMMVALLEQSEKISVIVAVGSAAEAMQQQKTHNFDVAMLDIALGMESANGIELATTLRSAQPKIGILIYSQHATLDFLNVFPENFRFGFSVLQKTATIDSNYLASVLEATSQGLNIVDPQITDSRPTMVASAVALLSLRQREIMSLVAAGNDSTLIAKELSLAPVTIRQELSKIYKILVPSPKPGTDLRTTAVLRYVRETRSYAWNANE